MRTKLSGTNNVPFHFIDIYRIRFSIKQTIIQDSESCFSGQGGATTPNHYIAWARPMFNSGFDVNEKSSEYEVQKFGDNPFFVKNVSAVIIKRGFSTGHAIYMENGTMVFLHHIENGKSTLGKVNPAIYIVLISWV